MAALDKPHDEMLADVVAYGKAVKKLADQYTWTSAGGNCTWQPYSPRTRKLPRL